MLSLFLMAIRAGLRHWFAVVLIAAALLGVFQIDGWRGVFSYWGGAAILIIIVFSCQLLTWLETDPRH